MTEEEYFRKTYPDSCYGDRPLSPYWDFFQDGVEFGERQSENKIADIKANCDLAIEGRDVKIMELEQQIEKMKNGDNCKYGCMACGNYICDLGQDNCNTIPFHCDKWEIKEND